MNLTTRENLCEQYRRIASVRGSLEALSQQTWCNEDFLKQRIEKLKIKLDDVQEKLTEITWSEDTDYSK